MIWLWLGALLLLSLPLSMFILLVWLHFWLRRNYLERIVRIFQEKPLFIIPRGQPLPAAEDVRFPTSNGLSLRGCYLKTTAPQRKGVILFGLEFGSNRWSCVPYCENLVENGYDIFAFEPRNQGESDSGPGYDPLQWITDFEVADAHAAIAYLKSRTDADPRGLGFLGISKGAAAGLLAAVNDPAVRCFVTDGVFATYTTLVPYMRKWYAIYNSQYILQGLLPSWYYGLIGLVALKKIAKHRQCNFPHLEPVFRKLAPRPLLMIHGGGDTYIKPDMARELFEKAKGPKDFWMVEGAKHNQAIQLVREEYHKRLLAFFNEHLGGAGSGATMPSPVQPSPILAQTS